MNFQISFIVSPFPRQVNRKVRFLFHLFEKFRRLSPRSCRADLAFWGPNCPVIGPHIDASPVRFTQGGNDGFQHLHLPVKVHVIEHPHRNPVLINHDNFRGGGDVNGRHRCQNSRPVQGLGQAHQAIQPALVFRGGLGLLALLGFQQLHPRDLNQAGHVGPV